MYYLSKLGKQPKDLRHCSLRDTEECSNCVASSEQYQWGKGTLLNMYKTKERLLYFSGLGGYSACLRER